MGKEQNDEPTSQASSKENFGPLSDCSTYSSQYSPLSATVASGPNISSQSGQAHFSHPFPLPLPRDPALDPPPIPLPQYLRLGSEAETVQCPGSCTLAAAVVARARAPGSDRRRRR
jgi:hypothetical protein